MAESQLSDEEAQEILDRLDVLHDQIKDIKRHVGALMTLHEWRHPEELEKARDQVDRES